jgi:hypothetical protein
MISTMMVKTPRFKSSLSLLSHHVWYLCFSSHLCHLSRCFDCNFYRKSQLKVWYKNLWLAIMMHEVFYWRAYSLPFFHETSLFYLLLTSFILTSVFVLKAASESRCLLVWSYQLLTEICFVSLCMSTTPVQSSWSWRMICPKNSRTWSRNVGMGKAPEAKC